jgi:aminomethyltransferase
MNRLPLHNRHLALGAKMGPFAGFEMPITYSGVKAEHMCVRNNVGVFDVSHMGEFFISGENALKFLQTHTSNNVGILEIGDAQYAYMPNTKGGIIDDLIVYRIGQSNYMLVVNASNIKKDWEWLTEKNKLFGINLENKSSEYVLLSVQGPNTHSLIKEISSHDSSKQKSFTILKTTIGKCPNIWISTTGYTGAGGVELYIPVKYSDYIFKSLLEKGKKYNIQPVGLAARDTLRLEMGYCLYGNELSDEISPVAARLSWCTDFSKSFVGDSFVKNDRLNGTVQSRIGFQIIGRGIPRQGYPIVDFLGNKIGKVTSGTSSPSINIGIGMGYINKNYAKVGNKIFIKIRGKNTSARVIKLPFI